jgi:hypothetical protein
MFFLWCSFFTFLPYFPLFLLHCFIIPFFCCSHFFSFLLLFDMSWTAQYSVWLQTRQLGCDADFSSPIPPLVLGLRNSRSCTFSVPKCHLWHVAGPLYFTCYSIETTEPVKSAWRYQSMYHLILRIFSQYSFKNIWIPTFTRAGTALLMVITLYHESLTVSEDSWHMWSVLQMPCSREHHSLSSRLANWRGNTGGRTSKYVTYTSAGGLRFSRTAHFILSWKITSNLST